MQQKLDLPDNPILLRQLGNLRKEKTENGQIDFRPICDSMRNMIQFNRLDGKTCPGYLAVPKSGSSAPGFVVIQEWWGLNDQIKETADRLADAGYRALVPDPKKNKVGQLDKRDPTPV